MQIGANNQMHDDLVYGDITYILNGVFFAVHNKLGRFCNEKQYADAVEEHLKQRGIRYVREYVLEPQFAGERPGRHRVDFIIEDAIVIELKAKRIIERSDYDQCLRYLNVLNHKLGLIVNFRQRVLTPERVLNANAPIKNIRISASSA